ncbi:hypothetical protein [Thermococcus peptonophilus]|uniref:hypothetical protein n=1 Tax=Thermococcus peptonophilus TaxID=53952 RepID=UPI000AFA473F
MGRISGSVLIGLGGILLWYTGGQSGETALVNLGIGSILLGLVVFPPMPGWGHVSRDALELAVEPGCTFLSNLVRDLELKGKAVVIPPYENLPEGGIFIPASEEFHVPLGGKLGEGTVLVTGTRQETGLLISPVPGRGGSLSTLTKT